MKAAFRAGGGEAPGSLESLINTTLMALSLIIRVNLGYWGCASNGTIAIFISGTSETVDVPLIRIPITTALCNSKETSRTKSKDGSVLSSALQFYSQDF